VKRTIAALLAAAAAGVALGVAGAAGPAAAQSPPILKCAALTDEPGVNPHVYVRYRAGRAPLVEFTTEGKWSANFCASEEAGPRPSTLVIHDACRFRGGSISLRRRMIEQHDKDGYELTPPRVAEVERIVVYDAATRSGVWPRELAGWVRFDRCRRVEGF